MRLNPIAAACLALAACVAAAPPAERNLVVSTEAPALTLRVDQAFTALEPLTFPIEDLTLAQRRIFVEAGPGKRVRRMVVIQFETVRPGSDFRFLFPSTPPRRFGAQTYRAGAFAFDEAKAAVAAPLREPGMTRRWLDRLGYRPPDGWKVARLARVSDPQGLSEVIIFYMEAADAKGLTADGESLSTQEAEGLFRRLEAAVRPVSG